MAHDSANNRIYIDTSTTPNKGICIADIQAVLRSSKNDIGGLIVNGDINKWAKYKPTRANGQNPTDWWKGERKSIYGSATGQYTNGFAIDVYTSLSSLKTAMSSSSWDGWVYEKPRGMSYGTNGEWFRFLDFNEYRRNASNPFTGVGLDGDTYPIGLECPIYLYVSFDSDYSLDLSDFPLFDDWYFGVAVYGGGSGQLVGCGTSSVTIGQQTDQSRCVVMALPARAQGPCTLYPFFSYNQISWSDSASEPSGTRRYIPLPIPPESITVVEAGPLANLTFTLAGGSLAYNATNARFTASFGRLSASNSGNVAQTIYKSQFYWKAHVELANDSSTYHDSSLTSLGLTGSVVIPVGDVDTEIFSSLSSKVITDSGMTQFLSDNNVTFAECRKFGYLYYKFDTTVDDYHLIATFEQS